MDKQELLESFRSRGGEVYDQAIEMLYSAENWSVLKEFKNITTYKKSTEEGLEAFKVEGFLAKPPKEVRDFLWNYMTKLHAELNPEIIQKSEVAKEFSDSERMIHEVAKVPFPGVASREVLFFSSKIDFGDENYAMLDTSVQDPDFPESQDPVRADIRFALHLCELHEDSSTHFSGVSLADAKGSIPVSIANFALSTRADFYDQLIQKILDSN